MCLSIIPDHDTPFYIYDMCTTKPLGSHQDQSVAACWIVKSPESQINTFFFVISLKLLLVYFLQGEWIHQAVELNPRRLFR